MQQVSHLSLPAIRLLQLALHVAVLALLAITRLPKLACIANAH
jgi:hypothetical protein